MSMLYNHYTICKMFTCIGILKHWRLSLFRYEMFIDFLSLVFRHEERERERERDTIFTILTVPTSSFSQLPSWTARPNLNSLTQQMRGTSHRPNWTHPGPNLNLLHPASDLNKLLFFKITKNPSPSLPVWCHSHPSPIFHLGFLLWHLWLSHPPRTSVCTCTKLNSSKPN